MNDAHLATALEHMRQAATDACAFVERMTKAEFARDKRTQQAVIMSLIIVGEAATRIMDRHADFTAAHPEIPWRAMRGMRNRMTHGYYSIDLDLVWETVQTAVPDLLTTLTSLPD